MRSLLLLATILVCSCGVRQRPAIVPEVLPSASTTYLSPDGRLYVAIRHTKRPFTVALIERDSGKVLGVAESSSVPNPDCDHMHGEVQVSYSDDLSTVVVHEDFSDASPNPRYILFQRRAGVTRYLATYFSPPTAHTDAPGGFDFVCATIKHVTPEALTLGYSDREQTHFIPIDGLLQTRSPKSSMEWSDEDYTRYEYD